MSSKKTAYAPVRNEELYRANFARRLSNAAAPHKLKSDKGTRAEKNRRAIRDYS